MYYIINLILLNICIYFINAKKSITIAKFFDGILKLMFLRKFYVNLQYLLEISCFFFVFSNVNCFCIYLNPEMVLVCTNINVLTILFKYKSNILHHFRQILLLYLK